MSETTIIRADRELVRDAWWESTPTGGVLVLRQTKFSTNGEASVKEFRFHGEDLKKLIQILAQGPKP